MKISLLFGWFYGVVVAAAMLCLVIVLFVTGPRVENVVLERRLETADVSSGMTYPIELKGLTLYGTRTEWLLDRFNNTAFFSFFGVLLLGLLTGQIKYHGPPR